MSDEEKGKSGKATPKAESKKPTPKPEKPDDGEDSRDPVDKDIEGLGTIIYQHAARFICIGPLRVAGGVRVLFNVPEKQAYIQIISPMCEAYITYYANNLAFLTSTSAAGVAWAGAIYVRDGKDDEDGDGKPDKPKQSQSRIGRNEQIPKCNLPDRSQSFIDTAHVVFSDPYQAQRFRTVLDTLRSASECTLGLLAPCPTSTANYPCVPQLPSAMVDPARFQQVFPAPFPPPCRPPPPGFGTQFFTNGCYNGQNPYRMAIARNRYPPYCTPCFYSQMNTTNNNPPAKNAELNSTGNRPYIKTGMGQLNPSCVGYDAPVLTKSEIWPIYGMPANPVWDMTAVNQQAPCPPSNGIDGRTMNIGEQGIPSFYNPYGQKHMAPCMPQMNTIDLEFPSNCGFPDPYSYENYYGKMMFFAPACLVRLNSDMAWTDLQKGNLKVYQGPHPGRYSLVLENSSRAISRHHYLTSDTDFVPAEKTQYGFTYSTVTRNEGRGNVVEHFLVSFMNGQIADQFKCLVDNIKVALEYSTNYFEGPDGETPCM